MGSCGHHDAQRPQGQQPMGVTKPDCTGHGGSVVWQIPSCERGKGLKGTGGPLSRKWLPCATLLCREKGYHWTQILSHAVIYSLLENHAWAPYYSLNGGHNCASYHWVNNGGYVCALCHSLNDGCVRASCHWEKNGGCVCASSCSLNDGCVCASRPSLTSWHALSPRCSLGIQHARTS